MVVIHTSKEFKDVTEEAMAVIDCECRRRNYPPHFFFFSRESRHDG